MKVDGSKSKMCNLYGFASEPVKGSEGDSHQ